MSFEWLADPTAWLGLGTLVVLEIVLGIDNLVFIAILADKLPVTQRKRARLVGLSLALFMRLGLLASISWVVTLTEPLFTVFGMGLSGRDLILLGGGAFLLFKATMELHERLEGGHGENRDGAMGAVFWQIIVQIMVLDIVFSLDSVITAVGMVDNLTIMMLAVLVAIVIMMTASGPLMNFVSAHPTVVILCLSFLLMIGFSLVVEGLGFHIPKGYLYAAIGFSVLIEALNQAVRRNKDKALTTMDLRRRTAAAVVRLLGGQGKDELVSDDVAALGARAAEQAVFAPEEQGMIQGVLGLTEQTAGSIMTSKADVVCLDVDAQADVLRQQILASPHSRFPIVQDSDRNTLLGIALAKDLLRDLLEFGRIDPARSLRAPLEVRDSDNVLIVMRQFRTSTFQMAIVRDDRESFVGIVTLTDILEAIAGDFPDHENDFGVVAKFRGGVHHAEQFHNSLDAV